MENIEKSKLNRHGVNEVSLETNAPIFVYETSPNHPNSVMVGLSALKGDQGRIVQPLKI